MLSNSTTTLRTGFSYGTITLTLPPGSTADATFNIPQFDGDNDNVRVMVGQLAPGPGASNWGCIVMTPHSVLAHDPNANNQSTCKVRFQNTGASSASLGANAGIYLMVVVTH